MVPFHSLDVRPQSAQLPGPILQLRNRVIEMIDTLARRGMRLPSGTGLALANVTRRHRRLLIVVLQLVGSGGFEPPSTG